MCIIFYAAVAWIVVGHPSARSSVQPFANLSAYVSAISRANAATPSWYCRKLSHFLQRQRDNHRCLYRRRRIRLIACCSPCAQLCPVCHWGGVFNAMWLLSYVSNTTNRLHSLRHICRIDAAFAFKWKIEFSFSLLFACERHKQVPSLLL